MMLGILLCCRMGEAALQSAWRPATALGEPEWSRMGLGRGVWWNSEEFSFRELIKVWRSQFRVMP